MNAPPALSKQARPNSALLHEDDAVCSLTLEPSLTNSSVSFNSASSASYNRDSNRSPPLQRLPFINAQLSLLDIDRDDSLDSPEDDDISLGNGVTFHSSNSIHDPLVSESASFMEQTENSLANISESLTGSFCNQGEINTSCYISDWCYYSDRNEANQTTPNCDQVVRNRLAEDFNYLLGSSVIPCCEERNIFCNFIGGNECNESEAGSKIRNRAGESWRARAYRIKRLRESRMMQASGGWNRTQSLGIGQTYSLDEFNIKNNVSDPYPSQRCIEKLFKPKHEVNADPLGRIIGDCIEPISPLEGEKNELEVVWKQRQDLLEEQDLCYDSDPGEPTFGDKKKITSEKIEQSVISINDMEVNANDAQAGDCSNPKAPRKMRRRMHFDSIIEGSDDEETPCDTTYSNIERQEENDQSNSNCDFYFDANEDLDSFENVLWDGGSSLFYSKNNMSNWELDMVQKIQHAINRTWTLTWHPTSADFPQESTTVKEVSLRSPLQTIKTNRNKNSYVSARSPRCVQFWFERGNRIRRNDVVEPKLMWREAYHPDLASQRKLNLSTTQGPHQICLLTIIRVLEATNNLDRKKYPFAKKSCSFVIRTCDNAEFVFEARSEELRNQILHQCKLVVARLASHAVMGDGEGMVGEFFVPTSFAVP